MSRRIAFMDPLVLAIRDGSKTVTRRMTAPKFKPGDVVDVCEALVRDPVFTACTSYRADGHHVVVRKESDLGPEYAFNEHARWPWKVRVLPARYCPAWAVRTRIEVLDVRQEALTAITDSDAMREGIARMGLEPTREAFLRAFENLHDLNMNADPDVWRIEFRKVEA